MKQGRFTRSSLALLDGLTSLPVISPPQCRNYYTGTLGLGTDPAGPVTQTETIAVPAGTPAGTYTLCIRAEENWPPGSESWGFSMTDCVDDVIHVEGNVDPVAVIEPIETELMLADIETLQGSLAKAERTARSGDKDAKLRVTAIQKCLAHLAGDAPLRMPRSMRSVPKYMRALSASPISSTQAD
jgi:hypothetical protein